MKADTENMTNEELLENVKFMERVRPHTAHWVLLHCGVIICIQFKILFFMRVSDQYANLTKLIVSVLIKTWPFVIFLILWYTNVCLLHKVSGISITEGSADDYPEISGNAALAI